MRIIDTLRGALVELVAPRACAACDATPVNDLGLCHACSRTLSANHVTDQVHDVPLLAPLAYAGAIVDAIHRLKYGNRPDLARPLAALVARTLRIDGLDAMAAFVPVPLHPRRLADRGYNQAALLCRHLARESRSRVLPMLLQRTRDTPQQAALGGAARTENVAGAFAIRPTCARGGRHVIVVDDVVTTGATAAECIGALRAAGEIPIAVVAVARAGNDRARAESSSSARTPRLGRDCGHLPP